MTPSPGLLPQLGLGEDCKGLQPPTSEKQTECKRKKKGNDLKNRRARLEAESNPQSISHSDRLGEEGGGILNFTEGEIKAGVLGVLPEVTKVPAPPACAKVACPSPGSSSFPGWFSWRG